MKQQIVALHGGDTYPTYEDFLNALSSKTVRLDSFRQGDWKTTLQQFLGDQYDVLLPRMPNPQNARYKEWKVWFEKIIPELDDDVIFIGHSLGGVFLAKYLSEETCPKHIRAVLLVAAPFETDGNQKLVEFAIENDLSRFRDQVPKILLYHSYDDPVVSFAEITKYLNLIPFAALRTFPDRGHFHADTFPELVEDVRNL